MWNTALLIIVMKQTLHAHVKMPDDLKTMIAAKLQDGVSKKKILDDIHDDV